MFDVLESFWFLLFIGFRICFKILPVECILYLHEAPNCGNSQNGWNDWKLEKKNTYYSLLSVNCVKSLTYTYRKRTDVVLVIVLVSNNILYWDPLSG